MAIKQWIVLKLAVFLMKLNALNVKSNKISYLFNSCWNLNQKINYLQFIYFEIKKNNVTIFKILINNIGLDIKP